MANRYTQAHKFENLAGPGDARPTALQIVRDNDLEGKWDGKVVLITGCSSGIGIETARAIVATGAKVYATVRDIPKGEKALGDILSSQGGKPGCELLEMDLNSLASVKQCAERFLAKESKLNILINNAGIMALPNRETTKDGFESQFGVNHLAHFYLFLQLKPALLAASTPDFNSRVVCVSSAGHKSSPLLIDDLNIEEPGKYAAWVGYGNSKTANIYMANEIDRRYGAQGLHALSLHPGGIETGLQVHSESVQAQMRDPKIIRLMKSTEQGAATTVWAAVAKEWEGKGGKYLDDCNVSPSEGQNAHGEWIYDEELAKKLWAKSCKLVGVDDD